MVCFRIIDALTCEHQGASNLTPSDRGESKNECIISRELRAMLKALTEKITCALFACTVGPSHGSTRNGIIEPDAERITFLKGDCDDYKLTYASEITLLSNAVLTPGFLW